MFAELQSRDLENEALFEENATDETEERIEFLLMALETSQDELETLKKELEVNPTTTVKPTMTTVQEENEEAMTDAMKVKELQEALKRLQEENNSQSATIATLELEVNFGEKSVNMGGAPFMMVK